MSECGASGYDTCVCHNDLPDALEALATAQQQVRDLRAALLAQRYRYEGEPTCWCFKYPDQDWIHSASCQQAKAALAATAEPEAGR